MKICEEENIIYKVQLLFLSEHPDAISSIPPTSKNKSETSSIITNQKQASFQKSIEKKPKKIGVRKHQIFTKDFAV